MSERGNRVSVKEQVVELLERNRNQYLSGNEIARRIGVSRTAVWKAIQNLLKEGYQIDAVPNRGYCMLPSTDVLSESGVRKYIGAGTMDFRFEIQDVVSSTNDVLKKRAEEGAEEGLVAAAVRQTAGKGRMGRSFYSPENTGLYFSLLLRPDFPPEYATYITTAAAVAVCRAIEEVSEQKPRIKWVNDVYIGEKKVCGILTEAFFGAETGTLDYIILGIGVNVYAPEACIQEGLREIMGAVFETTVGDARNHLLAAVLNHFLPLYEKPDKKELVAEYKERCFVLGQEILVLRKEEKIPAVALDLDQRCRLKVRYEDGREEFLNAGEISVRMKK